MKKKDLQIIILGILIFILVILLVSAAYYYRLNSGLARDIDEWLTCRNVDNYGSNDIFIPTKTSAEWASFYTNAPSGVSATSICASQGCLSIPDCLHLYPGCTYSMDCEVDNNCCCVDCPGAVSGCPTYPCSYS